MNPRERVKQLLALATDAGAGEHESRNAAYQAAKLIVEHKMLDVISPPPGDPRQTPFGGSPFASIFAGITVESVMQNLGAVAAGAGAMEILTLKNQNAVLERQKVRMQQEIARLNAELLQKADIPRPHCEDRPARRRRVR